ncbi:MAG: UDP-N-acetylmuramoyl-tripeptide--D-alanyl-D-alanine ligase [Acidobacteriales bacterium]|nr:UDP-N-acetylmuramoyl-tripeptide--D-alanyl-D-alanine ligase [Candidatus Koribacter versatilis]MBI3647043.1 UDP-N-acetylmuramoyl-tripeptide--D-alanyl-D-alanine ligase [Terriglobales bacterium]
MKLSLSRIAEFTAATGDYDPRALAQGYSIDSRTIQSGDLFFAVKGERLDGHDFVEQALSKGALAAVVRNDQLARSSSKAGLLAVDDTLVALQTLATAVRKLWGKTGIGITGSMGKTTTKEAMAHLLSVRHRVHRSRGNFNNHFGLPLGLLTLEPEYDLAVIEMGMSHAGEIAALARIALPNEGVVTSVGPVHLEFFDSVAGIARAKYELIEALPHGGTAVLNDDDEYVSQFGRDFKGKVILFGLKATADVRAENIELLGPEGTRFDLVSQGVRQPVRSPLLGKHNVYNVLAAAAVALEHGITPSEIAATLPSLQPADKRGQVVQLGNITVLNDCYNSSPKALMAAVDTLAAMPARRRIVVAGEMLELGPTGEQLHRECGRHIANKKLDFLLGVRGLAKPMVEAAAKVGMKAEFVSTPEEAGEWLARETRDGDAVLLKASRDVKLEKALETWQRKIGVSAANSTTNH